MARHLLLSLPEESKMKIFLYENVGPQAIQKIDPVTAVLNRSNQPPLKLIQKRLGLSTDEFLEVLEHAMGELEKQDVIRANQMALRRNAPGSR
jgi:hypothetical protein